MSMTVGGREFGWSRAEVEERMRSERPETIRKHVVEMVGTVFPPKQVLAVVTGWDRSSFTTAEAQRVLTKLGFCCRTARDGDEGLGWYQVLPDASGHAGGSEQAGGEYDARLAVLSEAVASLIRRVERLEGGAA